MASRAEMPVQLTAEELAAAEMPMPEEGSKAAKALEANEAKNVTRLMKIYKRHHPHKPPTRVGREHLGGAEELAYVPGKLITRDNDMYIMSIGMMLGLRVSLLYNASVTNMVLRDEDMKTGDHYSFPPEGSKGKGRQPATPRHPLGHKFEFKDYCSKVFHQVRLLSGIDTESYMNSVCGDANFYQFTTNSKRFVYNYQCARGHGESTQAYPPRAPQPLTSNVPPCSFCCTIRQHAAVASSSSSRRTGSTW